MRFWKMNGAGNDFVILNNLEEHLPLEQLPQIARTLCERMPPPRAEIIGCCSIILMAA